MSHIFISYSKKDRTYARMLTDHLVSLGFNIWIDDRIDYGDDWWRTIVQAIRRASAFIVIMTDEADASAWVQREVTLADKYQIPPFPIWLSGDFSSSENWAIYIRTQYEDVTGGQLPSEHFFERLEQFAPPTTQRRGEDITPRLEDINILDEVVKSPPPKVEIPSRNRTNRVQLYLLAFIKWLKNLYDQSLQIDLKLNDKAKYAEKEISPPSQIDSTNSLWSPIQNEVQPDNVPDISLSIKNDEVLANQLERLDVSKLMEILSRSFFKSFSNQDWHDAQEKLSRQIQLETELAFHISFYETQIQQEIERLETTKKLLENKQRIAKNRYEHIKAIIKNDPSASGWKLLQDFWKTNSDYDPDNLAEKYRPADYVITPQNTDHIFLSYSHDDRDFMSKLRDDLQIRGVTLWTDGNLIVGTSDWEAEIQHAIETSRGVIVVLSPNAKVSKWVNLEIRYALEHNKTILPVLIAGNSNDAIPIKLINAQYSDMTENKYMKGLDDLILSLRTHLNAYSDTLKS